MLRRLFEIRFGLNRFPISVLPPNSSVKLVSADGDLNKPRWRATSWRNAIKIWRAERGEVVK